MTKKEFKDACTLAFKCPNLTGTFDNIQLFDGFGLSEFKPVACTLKDLAGLIKWQCLMFNGSVDAEALDDIWSLRKKFLVIDY
jgi:hypothetical protein